MDERASISGANEIIGVREMDLRRLFRQRDEALVALRDAQTRMTEMVESTLHRTVRAFHLKFGHPVHTTPRVPDAAQLGFRLALITEEYLELLAACGIGEDQLTVDSGYAQTRIKKGGWWIKNPRAPAGSHARAPPSAR